MFLPPLAYGGNAYVPAPGMSAVFHPPPTPFQGPPVWGSHHRSNATRRRRHSSQSRSSAIPAATFRPHSV
jgi:hypothetical protein